ncbi:hypothetical protein Q2T94_07780 [Paeniglutamicibacter sulfureus]|uniref:hypothetical protein n=1 Tax=Paeniglutamicibacter sulfureus TaxID=43666 RepID=UPI0026660D46|nr:hypothetical protein [Paeniglutamicibacter sulfureus]MDO2934195.1 hypothetical protein [Paeniglutamicibacter sulfureus]
MRTDPEKVPAFPVYTLQLSADRQAVTLDGAAVPLDADEDFVSAGTAAIVAKLHRHGLDAVRARVLDASTDTQWDMIVDSGGQFLDLTPQQEAAAATRERHHRRRRLLIRCFAATLAILLGGAVAAAVVAANQPAAHPVAYTPAGAGATLPAAPPPAHSPTATWSHPAAADSTVNLVEDGMLLTVDPAGTMTGRNPATGQPLWRGSKAPLDVRSVHKTTWAGQPVYAATTGRELLLWPTRMPEDTDSVSPTAIPLESQHSARVDVGTPYIDLGDWYIRIPDATGTLQEVMIPPGSTVLTTTGDGQVITANHDTIYTLDNQGAITAQGPYTAPEGTTGYPTHVWGLDASNLLLGWGGASRTLAVLNLETRQIPFSAQPRSLPGARSVPLVDAQARTAAIGSVGLRYGANPAVVDLKSFTPTAVRGPVVYANTNNGPVTMDLTGSAPEPETWESYSPRDPAPALVTPDAVYLVATQLERTVVYRSDRVQ